MCDLAANETISGEKVAECQVTATVAGLVLDATQKVQATESKRFAREDQQTLETIRARVYVAVHRR